MQYAGACPAPPTAPVAVLLREAAFHRGNPPQFPLDVLLHGAVRLDDRLARFERNGTDRVHAGCPAAPCRWQASACCCVTTPRMGPAHRFHLVDERGHVIRVLLLNVWVSRLVCEIVSPNRYKVSCPFSGCSRRWEDVPPWCVRASMRRRSRARRPWPALATSGSGSPRCVPRWAAHLLVCAAWISGLVCRSTQRRRAISPWRFD